MEIRIKAYAYTIDIITEIRYFCKCNNAVFGKFRIIFTCAISKTDCSLHHSFHALFKISGNGKFVRTAVLTPHPSRNLRKSTPCPRPTPPRQPFQKPHYPSKIANTLASLVKGRWIDGKPQTVALLHFCLRYIRLFDLSNFSPSRRRDCYTTPSKNRTIPRLALNLPPLSKVRCCRPK